jgi:hypothetical protein
MGRIYNANTVKDDLVFYIDAANPRSYPGTGTNFIDVSNIKNIATLVNAPTYNNTYFSFDGLNEHIILNDSASVDVSSEKTFEMWVRFNTFSVSGAISLFNKRLTAGSQEEYFIFIYTGSGSVANEITFDYSNSGSRWLTGYVPPLNEWVYIVLNVNTASPIRNLYINGQLQASDTTSMGTLTAYTHDVYIGKDQAGSSSYYLNGDIGLAKIYNRALTSNEIRQNYLATKGRFQ